LEKAWISKIPDACFDSADPSELRYEAMARLLLELFANQLSFFANEILIQQAEREPYRVRMARAYISDHQTEDFSLSYIADFEPDSSRVAVLPECRGMLPRLIKS
jgi:hypothetical protein